MHDCRLQVVPAIFPSAPGIIGEDDQDGGAVVLQAEADVKNSVFSLLDVDLELFGALAGGDPAQLWSSHVEHLPGAMAAFHSPASEKVEPVSLQAALHVIHADGCLVTRALWRGTVGQREEPQLCGGDLLMAGDGDIEEQPVLRDVATFYRLDDICVRRRCVGNRFPIESMTTGLR